MRKSRVDDEGHITDAGVKIHNSDGTQRKQALVAKRIKHEDEEHRHPTQRHEEGCDGHHIDQHGGDNSAERMRNTKHVEV